MPLLRCRHAASSCNGTFTALSFLLTIAPVLSACSSTPEADSASTGSTSEALVDTSNTPPLVPTAGELPLLPVHGRFTQQNSRGATLAYLGQFSRGDDLVAAPTTARDPWVISALTPGIVPVRPALNALTGALDAADADNGGVDAGAIGSLFELLSFLHVTPSATHDSFTTFQGYTPIRARWQSAQYEGGGVFRNIPLLGRMQKNPAPVAVEEFRERGARLYCAARKLAFEASSQSRSMGEQSAFSVKLLGRKIDFLVVEPRLAMNGPKVFGREEGIFSLTNGVQAFEVPFGFGTRITPIRGLGLPGLREIRYPVELVSADTEAMTPALLGRRSDTTYGYQKQYTTAEHVDAIQSAWETMSASLTVPLFESGLLHVSLTLQLDADIGRPIVPGAPMPLGVSAQPYDRVVDASTVTGFAFPATRASWSPLFDPTRTITYHDGAWAANNCIRGEFHPCPAWEWAVHPSETSPLWQTSTANLRGFGTRLLQDDDHVYRTRTSLGLTGKIRGVLGFDRVGPFRVSISVEGGINGTVGSSHVLRDAMFAELVPGESAMRAASAVTVRPRTDASASLIETDATLHFSFHVPFYGDVSWDPNLLHAPSVTLASWDTDDAHTAWREESALRIGTGANSGDVTKKPNVFSHLPKGPDELTFTESVDQCLADTRANLPPAPLCIPEPPSGAPPRTNTCMFVTGQLPAAVCSNIAGAAAMASATPDQASCLEDYYAFLCKPVSNQYSVILSHIVDIADAQVMTELGNVMNKCIAAYVSPAAPDPALAASTFTKSFFRMAFCDEHAVILSPADTFGPWSSTPGDPPAVSAPASNCR